jgi:hypothetical protein
MTLLSDMKSKLPVGSQIELSTSGRSLGIFEVVDVNCGVGCEDTMIHVAYRPVGDDGCGNLLSFSRDSFPYTATDPQMRVNPIQAQGSGANRS